MVTVGVYEGFFRNRMVIAKSARRGAVKLAVAAAIGCLAALTGIGGGYHPGPAGIQRTAGGRDCHSLGDGAGNRRGRHYWRGRQRLARSRCAAYSMGHVDLAIFAAMMPTILIAAPIGVRAGHWLSEAWLRRIYTVLLFVIAADLIRKLMWTGTP